MVEKKSIQRFIAFNFMYSEDETAIPVDQSLLESGILDSTGVLELVQFLETEYRIAVKDEEIVRENLDSVDAIAAYVERKMSVPVDAKP